MLVRFFTANYERTQDFTAELSAVPREGEAVRLGGKDYYYEYVKQVIWLPTNDEVKVYVMLRRSN